MVLERLRINSGPIVIRTYYLIQTIESWSQNGDFGCSTYTNINHIPIHSGCVPCQDKSVLAFEVVQVQLG